MPSASLPCPSCATALILDEENAGQDVFCPNCNVHLRLPSRISASRVPEIIGNPSPPTKNRKKKPSAESAAPPSPTTPPPAEPVHKSALPQGRSKSSEEEIKRLAAAAAAAGAAHSFPPEAATLPADHHRTVLPTKRALPPNPAEEEPAPKTPPDLRAPLFLPNRRATGAPLEPSPIIRAVEPINPPEEIEISATPLRGPSRFVGAPPPAAVPPEPIPAPPAQTDEETTEDATKRGFRLGGERNPHFTPVHTTEPEAEAANWGATTHTPEEAARSRRFVSLALLIVLLAAGGVGIYVLRHAFQSPSATATTAESSSPEEDASSGNVMQNVEDARRVLKRFLEADTVEKMAAEVRHPDLSRPRMERYYAANSLKPRKQRSESQSWSEVRIAETEFIRAAWELDDFRVYPIALEVIPGADPKVDWESFVNWSELPWKDFLKTPPEQSVDFRVSVTHDARDQYYNYSFKGRELDLMCFKIEDPERYGSCWAYCDKDSDAASQLLFHLKGARQQRQVDVDGKWAISCILRLRFPPEGRKTNQVMIEKFVHDNWVQP